MINKISLKFVFGFLAIVCVGLVILVAVSSVDANKIDKSSEMNMAKEQF